MARSTTERLAEKTAERQFLYELETDFELAPAASRAVLATAQQVLLASGGEPRAGQMRATVVSAKEPSGKPLAAMKKVSVVVSVDGGLEDLEVLRQFGVGGQRRVRLLRMTEEAVDQEGVLTQEDLARLCQSDARTIRRDVVALRGEGHWVPTRGAVKETGRGPSHKAKIVELYLRRMTYSEIVRRTRSPLARREPPATLHPIAFPGPQQCTTLVLGQRSLLAVEVPNLNLGQRPLSVTLPEIP